MVGGNRVELAGHERVLQGVTMSSIANRRRALELGRAARDVLRVEVEIVRAGLRRYVHAASARMRDHGGGLGARDVDDVNARARRLRHPDHEGDSLVFRGEYDLQPTAGAFSGETFLDTQRSSMDRIATDVARSVVTAILEAF